MGNKKEGTRVVLSADDVRQAWDRLAEDWLTQVGADGDRNRELASDPVLLECLGEVRAKRVLDAGCGTGYLTRKLADQGAGVEGVDLSPKMIEIARREHPGLEFRVDSISELATCDANSFDRIASNYVLMDAPDLEGAVASLYRVLKPGGAAVVVFSHPCFPAGRSAKGKGIAMSYHWQHSYFEPRLEIDPPWKHFSSEFPWHHRPLSDYFDAFVGAGFIVERLAEPYLKEDRAHLAADKHERRKYASRPYSIVFKLRK